MHQDELLDTQRDINRIKAKYADQKKQAWDAHKAIVAQEKEELGELVTRNKELRELVIDDNNFIDGITRSSRKDFYVEDLDALPSKYKKVVPDKKLLKKEMEQSEYTKPIPGLKVFDKYSIRVSAQ